MKIVIKIYPAKNGDSFLISYGSIPRSMHHILVDCGYTETFEKYYRKDLENIGNSGGGLEKLILTHIDADHILGAIKFLKENNKQRLIEIKEVWYNSFRHLFQKDGIVIDRKKELTLKQIITRGHLIHLDKDTEESISAQQGTTVGALILQGGYSWNTDFQNRAACVENRSEIALSGDSDIYLLSPDKEKLTKLKEFWEDELKKFGVNYNYENSELYDDAYEMLMTWEAEKIPVGEKEISAVKKSVEELLKKPFNEDTTVTNGSSIAFILKIERKRILLLGDAHPNLIVKSLNRYQEEGKIYFNLIKVSHHGSFNNINQDMLEKIDAERYLFSTNGGKHKHPDKETIAHIVTRKAEFHRNLYFNYMTDNSEHFNKTEWMQKYNYSIHYLNHQPYSIEL